MFIGEGRYLPYALTLQPGHGLICVTPGCLSQVAGDPIEAAALKAIKWEILERPGQPTDCRPLVRTTTTTRHYDSLFYTLYTSLQLLPQSADTHSEPQ